MKLQQLLEGLPTPPVAVAGDAVAVEITAIAYDSRKVAPGGLFVAVRGTRTDGHRYIGDALRQGAGSLTDTTYPFPHYLRYGECMRRRPRSISPYLLYV